ncbi:MAG: polysaccharide deacetylase family protein [Fimbriimonas ginsengisoli]|nr:polysaccharide deacetylase family protein [Fimbriimonas ginsengisoli]
MARRSGIWLAALAAVIVGGTCAPGRPAAGMRVSPAAQAEAGYIPAAQMAARQQAERERGITFAKLVQGNPKSRTIALTFDDGPHAGLTERLLAILRQEKVKATFFIVGRMAERYPHLVRMEAAEGHEIANHTYSHFRLPALTPAQMEQELRCCSATLQRIMGVPTRLFRPPGGEYDDRVVALTKRLGLTMVLWTSDPADFAYPPAPVIEQRILRRIDNGGIILLHDGVPQTMAMLPDLIRRLKSQGYRFVTCSEMARRRWVVTQGGPCVAPKKIRLKA